MQAVLQQHLGDAFEVESAGLRRELAGRPANHRSVACMKDCGVYLSGHVSRWIGELDLSQYRWIVCVGPAEADMVRSALGAGSASVLVANEDQGGIADPLRTRAGRLSGLPGSAGPGDAAGRAAHQRNPWLDPSRPLRPI